MLVDQWLQEVKREYRDKELGMILVHNGIVRATSKHGKKVRGMNLSWDTEKLDALIREFRKKEGIAAIRVWINKGELMVCDDIMYVLVAGRFRTDVLPVFEDLVYRLKNEVIKETEI